MQQQEGDIRLPQEPLEIGVTDSVLVPHLHSGGSGCCQPLLLNKDPSGSGAGHPAAASTRRLEHCFGGDGDTVVRSLGEETCQRWGLWSSRRLPEVRGPHRGGRWLPPAPSPQPPLGFGAKTGLVSDVLICMVAFWVRGIEPFCSALLCPVLHRLHIGLLWGDLLPRALLGAARGRGLYSCAPLGKCFGVWLSLGCPG